MGNLILSFAISFIVAYLIGKPVIRKLQQMKFGQKILEDGPTWHMSKQYTPTMGGWIFIIAIFVAITVAMLFDGGAPTVPRRTHGLNVAIIFLLG